MNKRRMVRDQLTEIVVHGSTVLEEETVSSREDDVAADKGASASVCLGPVPRVANKRELDHPLVSTSGADVGT